MAQTPNFNKLVLLRGFSTYFDRKIFYYSDVDSYENKATGYYEQDEINFNPNDGIVANVDLSSLDAQMDETTDIHEFSYCLVVNRTTGDIVSRWYIMDVVRETNGIYRFTLKRDVVAESLKVEKFVNEAPIYVEKAILEDLDPMIVNSEGMNFNQIKKSEALIQDESQYGCIVGYFESGSSATGTTQQVIRTPDQYIDAQTIVDATGLTLTEVNSLLSGGSIKISQNSPTLVFGISSYPLVLLSSYKETLTIPNSFSGNVGDRIEGVFGAWSHAIGAVGDDNSTWVISAKAAEYFKNHISDLLTDFNTILNSITPGDKYYDLEIKSKLSAFRGQIIKIGSDYYTIKNVTQGNTTDHAEVVIDDGVSTEFNSFITYVQNLKNALNEDLFNEKYSQWQLYVNYKIADVSISLEKWDSFSYDWLISSSANSLLDAPYSMFVIPYGDVMRFSNGILNPVVTGTMTKLEALKVACDIAVSLGTHLYDLQLLPYLPDYSNWIVKRLQSIPPDIFVRYVFNYAGKTEHYDYDFILDGGGHKQGIIIYPQNSSFSRDISFEITPEDEAKIESQCNFYRICSPNYNGVFEFNLAKNGMKNYNMHIDCTYKPYTPFIRVTPDFSFLYGTNFQDGRGLICGGDFSLARMVNQWIEYQINNKNFANIFAREIQNLDFTNKQERFREPFTLAAGTIGGGAAGAVAGFKGTGSPYGAIAGAAVGLTAGAVGGALDAQLNEQRRQETKDLAIDRFNMSLQNIKALPDSLARNSAFNIINKIFPFVEYYSCTDEEKEALRNKVKYDGMTVGRIGSLLTYMGGNLNPKFFKGQIIRAEGIEEDNHFVATLYEEIAKGVYI